MNAPASISSATTTALCVAAGPRQAADGTSDDTFSSPTPRPTPPHIIKAETNLLRFPVFALSTKGLRGLDGIECTGRRTIDGREEQFRLTVSRNSAQLYPGPLSRKVHFAILSLITERGFPVQNPVSWRWRELVRRMDVAYAGAVTIRRLKQAIRSTHGIVLTTEYALREGESRHLLPKRERGYHLYSDYVFLDDHLPSGEIADMNYLWLSGWYVANLNAFYTAPLDYGLWRRLNDESPIASRLYEFLLFNFAARQPSLTIRYHHLAQFLPVRVERYRSDAGKQLNPAIDLLKETGVLNQATWRTGAKDSLQLRFEPGGILRPFVLPKPVAETFPMAADQVIVRELRRDVEPALVLVQRFHELWSGYRPLSVSPGERKAAEELLQQFPRDEIERVLPAATRTMKIQFKDAKTFGAARAYIQAEILARRKKVQSERQTAVSEQEERNQQETSNAELAALRKIWDSLSATEREAIREQALEGQPKVLRKYPGIVEKFCLRELAKKMAETPPER